MCGPSLTQTSLCGAYLYCMSREREGMLAMNLISSGYKRNSETVGYRHQLIQPDACYSVLQHIKNDAE
jgi:hypothetical protein